MKKIYLLVFFLPFSFAAFGQSQKTMQQKSNSAPNEQRNVTLDINDDGKAKTSSPSLNDAVINVADENKYWEQKKKEQEKKQNDTKEIAKPKK
ncbi:MAG: hypothetical protein HY063_04850 [Bacteroidetes bacterium]|nr:hypothetical protein [Bacteroidota bacterium]